LPPPFVILASGFCVGWFLDTPLVLVLACHKLNTLEHPNTRGRKKHHQHATTFRHSYRRSHMDDLFLTLDTL
jgi:hypothetical protein